MKKAEKRYLRHCKGSARVGTRRGEKSSLECGSNDSAGLPCWHLPTEPKVEGVMLDSRPAEASRAPLIELRFSRLRLLPSHAIKLVHPAS